MSKKNRANAPVAQVAAPVETTAPATTLEPTIHLTGTVAPEFAQPAKSKGAKAKAPKEPKVPGVIDTLWGALQNTDGVTKVEVLDKLVALFPDRNRDQMGVTVGIQLSRLEKDTNRNPDGRQIISAKVEGRGRVYGMEGTLSVGSPKVEAPVDTTAAA